MKKYAIIVAAAGFLMSFTGKDQPNNWNLDKAHAKLGFSVTHMMISDVDGNFKNVEAKITASSLDFSNAIVELTADVNSINTDNERRDQHLKGADFFDAAKYPKLTFKSKTFKKVADKKYIVTGDLTLHGVTKTVTLDATLRGTTVHPYSKKNVAGFKVTGTIKRSDFGVGTATPDGIVSDEVTLAANAEFVQE
jgi:polyisoprenoid-binding protein YceI